MTGTNPTAWPRDVRRQVQSVRSVGLEPAVHGSPGGEWTVIVEGERIRATAVFATRSGRARYLHGELSVDGQSRPAVTSLTALRDLWDELEDGSPVASPELVPIEPADATLAPAAVRASLRMLLANGLITAVPSEEWPEYVRIDAP